MNLPQRCGRERFALETREESFRRLAELRAKSLADHPKRHRRNVRARGGEDLERLGRQEIVAHRQHLHELGERAAELGGALDDRAAALRT